MSSVKEYMWNSIVLPDLHPELKGMTYTLKQWPDFGRLPYKKSFIDLCALLMVGRISQEQMKSFAHCDDATVNHLLNTLKISNLLTVEPCDIAVNKSAAFVLSGYKAKLMKFIRNAYRKVEQRNQKIA